MSSQTALSADAGSGASDQTPSTLVAQLKRMASPDAAADRLSILRSITDLYFAGAGHHTDTEVYLFNDIMERIVDQISRSDKIALATRLSAEADSPYGIVRKLAFDSEVDIARPVIQYSSVLGEEDLVRLAQQAPQSHLEVLADRRNISASITDVLIDRGNQNVLHTVSANRTAEISLGGFRHLAERALDDPKLQGLLIDRPDLSKEAVDRLLPAISDALAARLKARGLDIADGSVDAVLTSARNQFVEALGQRKKNARSVQVMVSMIESGDMTLEQAVASVVHSERLLDAATILSHFVKLDRNTVFKMLANGPQPAIAILCRSLEFEWTTVESILALRAKKQRMLPGAERTSKREYGEMEAAAAQRIVRFWQLRANVGPAQAG
jgi:uncharacterized protein (DUF2336 family)